MEKKKVSLYLTDETYTEVKQSYRKGRCSSYNEFLERAIVYYLGYVNSEHMTDYLSPTIMSSVKLAVEIAVMNNLFAASLDIDEEKINSLRRECETEVRKLNGDFNMNDAIRWQKR